LRINGLITQIKDSKMTLKEVEDMVFPLMNQRLKSIFNEKHEVDFSVDGKELGRFRFNIFIQKVKLCGHKTYSFEYSYI